MKKFIILVIFAADTGYQDGWEFSIYLPWLTFSPDRSLIWWIASAYGCEDALPSNFAPDFDPYDLDSIPF